MVNFFEVFKEISKGMLEEIKNGAQGIVNFFICLKEMLEDRIKKFKEDRNRFKSIFLLKSKSKKMLINLNIQQGDKQHYENLNTYSLNKIMRFISKWGKHCKKTATPSKHSHNSAWDRGKKIGKVYFRPSEYENEFSIYAEADEVREAGISECSVMVISVGKWEINFIKVGKNKYKGYLKERSGLYNDYYEKWTHIYTDIGKEFG